MGQEASSFKYFSPAGFPEEKTILIHCLCIISFIAIFVYFTCNGVHSVQTKYLFQYCQPNDDYEYESLQIPSLLLFDGSFDFELALRTILFMEP